MENVIKTGIIIEPDDKRDILTEFEKGNLTEDKNYMLPFRDLWESTSDKKTLIGLKIFYEKNIELNTIGQVLDNDRVIISHGFVLRTATPVDINDLMYFPNKK